VCLGWLVQEKTDMPPGIAVRTLLHILTKPEHQKDLDQHAVREIIEWLQANPDTDENELFKIEWGYLPLLDHQVGRAPRGLERRLARDPAFFCEIIRLVFRSDKEDRKESQPSEQEQKLARNAYHLLDGWRTAPGTTADGKFNGEAFSKWLGEVKRQSKESGHFRIALDAIGKMLPHAPPSPDGLWIDRSIAEELNARDAAEMRSGFTCELFNMRGTHGFSAGKEEREIAGAFFKKAEALEENGYARIATAVRDLGKQYERDAEREEKSDPFEDG